MTRKLTAAELGKAARNVKRIEGFLAARCTWTLEPADRGAFDALKAVVDRFAFNIGQRALKLGIESRVKASQPPAPIAPETFDGPQLERFAFFLKQLDVWFHSRRDAVPEKGAGRFLGEIKHSLEMMHRSLIAIDEHQAPIPESASEPPARETTAGPLPSQEPTIGPAPTEQEFVPPGSGDQDPAPAAPEATALPGPPKRAPSTAVDDIYEGTRDKEGKPPVVPPELIAFASSEVEPMYTWVGPESVDLTPLARERLEMLFEEQGVSFFRYQFENFADEIKKRIENAPDGHVLVVKIRSIGEERKPFLSYISEVELARQGH